MDIKKLVRENILNLEPYISARSQNLSGIFLDANENSFGSCSSLDAELNRYPDPSQGEIREAMSSYLGTLKEKIIFGNGSDELIDLVIRIFCEPGKDSAIIVEPTYGMYEVALNINGVEIIRGKLEDEFGIVPDEILSSKKSSTKLLFLCSPNNPTGGSLRKEDLQRLIRGFDGIVVLDEAYYDFNPSGSMADQIDEFENLIILRTMSKAWGMAGLRAGYVLASEYIVSILEKVKAPYNIGRLSSREILEAIKRHSLKDYFVKEILKERQRLSLALRAMDGITRVYPSDANFILFCLPDAARIQGLLKEKGLIVRDRSGEVPGALRLTVGRHEENSLFLYELSRILNPYSSEHIGAEDVSGLLIKEGELSKKQERISEVFRQTKETSIRLSLNLDGKGRANVNTGIGFFNHMLEQIARHSNIDLNIEARGDLDVDFHHTVEDTGICLGEAISKAIGERRGIRRYGFFLPMDDAVAFCALDLGGRSYLKFKCKFREGLIGQFPTELALEFFRAVSDSMKANIYVKADGVNDHHKMEAIFKAFAKSLNEALRIEPRNPDGVPSTKGSL